MEKAIGLAASIIGIFVFITGVQSIPQLRSSIPNANSENQKKTEEDSSGNPLPNNSFENANLPASTILDPAKILADYKRNPNATEDNYLGKQVRYKYDFKHSDITDCPDIYLDSQFLGLISEEKKLCLRSEFFIGDLSAEDYSPSFLQMKNEAGVFCIFNTQNKGEERKLNTAIFNNIEGNFDVHGNVIYIADSSIGGGWRYSSSSQFWQQTRDIGNMTDGFKGYFRVILLSDCMLNSSS